MAHKMVLGRVDKFEFSAVPSALVGVIAVFVILTGFAALVLHLPLTEAVIGGLAATALHWLGVVLHDMGHALAARSTDYPMTGIRFYTVLGMTLYPKDEPELPAAIHLRRAFGGPLMSLLVSVFALIIAIALFSVGGAVRFASTFFFLDMLLTFTLGAMLPLGFTDGSTILYWLGKRK